MNLVLECSVEIVRVLHGGKKITQWSLLKLATKDIQWRFGSNKEVKPV